MKSDYASQQQVVFNGASAVVNGDAATNGLHNGQASPPRNGHDTAVNGHDSRDSDDYDEQLVRQVNLAAAYHDHISCVKPVQKDKGLFAVNGSAVDTLFGSPYSHDDRQQLKKLQEMILFQLDLIQHQQEQLLKKERQLQGRCPQRCPQVTAPEQARSPLNCDLRATVCGLVCVTS